MAMSIVETKTVSCLVMLAQWWSPAQWCSQDIWHSVDGTSTGKCRASHDVNLPSVTTRSPPDLPPQRTDSSLSLSLSLSIIFARPMVFQRIWQCLTSQCQSLSVHRTGLSGRCSVSLPLSVCALPSLLSDKYCCLRRRRRSGHHHHHHNHRHRSKRVRVHFAFSCRIWTLKKEGLKRWWLLDTADQGQWESKGQEHVLAG